MTALCVDVVIYALSALISLFIVVVIICECLVCVDVIVYCCCYYV